MSLREHGAHFAIARSASQSLAGAEKENQIRAAAVAIAAAPAGGFGPRQLISVHGEPLVGTAGSRGLCNTANLKIQFMGKRLYVQGAQTPIDPTMSCHGLSLLSLLSRPASAVIIRILR